MIVQAIIGSLIIIMVIYDAIYYKIEAVDIIFLILGIILLFFAYNNYKVLKNPNISPLFQQLDGSFKDKLNYLNKQLNNIIYEDKNLIMTEDFMFNKIKATNVIFYEDIIWAYMSNNYINYRGSTRTIFIYYESKVKKYYYDFNKENKIIEILNKIHEQNPRVKIGYTKENYDYYKKQK